MQMSLHQARSQSVPLPVRLGKVQKMTSASTTLGSGQVPNSVQDKEDLIKCRQLLFCNCRPRATLASEDGLKTRAKQILPGQSSIPTMYSSEWMPMKHNS